MAHVQLANVRKSYGLLETIHGISLDIFDKEFVVFVGPSGCGKSTLLRLIAGLESISGGDLLMDGVRVNDMPPKERGIAMVFQSYALYPHMTVFENMAFGLELAGVSKAERAAKVCQTADILELTPLLERLPKQLSGGQRQRVAIGRAIVREPKVFLFDEPLSNLDAALRVQTRLEIAKLHNRMGATMIYVTHDQVEAMTLATKIVVLSAGSVEQVGSPLDLYHRPRNLFVAGFIGSPQMNFIKTVVEAADNTGVKVALPGGSSLVAEVNGTGVSVGDTLTLGIRPEHLAATDGNATLPGTIEVIEQLGESHFVYARLGDGSLLTVRAPGDSVTMIGAAMTARVRSDHCHLFGVDGLALPRLMTA